jgi:hypothetical protein
VAFLLSTRYSVPMNHQTLSCQDAVRACTATTPPVAMHGQDWRSISPCVCAGLLCTALLCAAQDIGQGLMEPDAAKGSESQQMGTEYGAAAQERSSGGGSDTGSQAQEMSQGSPTSEEGGRFDEEQVAGNHPYDPRPR